MLFLSRYSESEEFARQLLTTGESAAFLETEPQKLSELIASGKIHGIETATGNLRICKNSLYAK